VTSRILRALAAIVLAAGLLAAGGSAAGPAPVAAATPGLTLVTAASYVVAPAAGQVAVTVRITATNHLHNTASRRYYYRTVSLAVLPDTSGFRLRASGGAPSATVSKRTPDYTLLRLDLGRNLGAGASRSLTLTFVLKDPGGAPDRPIRISPSLVSFYAWAFATASTPGSSVSVTVPAGYAVTIGRGPLTGPTTDAVGDQTWTSGRLDAPLAFVADVTADRPAAYVASAERIAIGTAQADLQLRSWPDDPAWRDRVDGLLRQGLPVLAEEIGLPWPVAENPLIVEEALIRTTGGYAGLFDPSQHLIQIAYAAPTGVVLHEAAHAWLNGSLLADRWAAEAFASYYAETAARQLDVPIDSPELTSAEQAAAIPLNAWGGVGSEPTTTEAYAYAASLALARAVAERAGPDGLRKVWAQAAAGLAAYQPPAGLPEPASGPPDWRGLLDLLEDDTGASYDDLWRTWVVRPSDLPALDARGTARAAYEAALTDAGAWQLPAAIRAELRAWQFGQAESLLADAEAVLGQRNLLERSAAAAGVELPATLERDFEAGDLAGAASEATHETATVQAIQAAAAARPADVSPLESIGLFGATPDADLAAARADLAAGSLDAADSAAATARSDWIGSANVGIGRLVGVGILAAPIVLLLGLLIGRRRARPATGRPNGGGPSGDSDPLHSAP